jgi:phage protein D
MDDAAVRRHRIVEKRYQKNQEEKKREAVERSDKDSAKRNEKAIDGDSAAMRMHPRTPYEEANDSRRECWETTSRSDDGRVQDIHCCQHHRE